MMLSTRKSFAPLFLWLIQCCTCEVFKISLLYPLTNIVEQEFFNYSWAFEKSLARINNHSLIHDHNITLEYTIDNTDADIKTTLAYGEQGILSPKKSAKIG